MIKALVFILYRVGLSRMTEFSESRFSKIISNMNPTQLVGISGFAAMGAAMLLSLHLSPEQTLTIATATLASNLGLNVISGKIQGILEKFSDASSADETYRFEALARSLQNEILANSEFHTEIGKFLGEFKAFEIARATLGGNPAITNWLVTQTYADVNKSLELLNDLKSEHHKTHNLLSKNDEKRDEQHDVLIDKLNLVLAYFGTQQQPMKPVAEHSRPIFISYARRDGREIAANLRQKLQDLGFTIWQDVVAMEGGEKWWTQIKEAIEGSAIMVLILTDAALKSGVVYDEWTHARTVGTHIMPITQNDAIFSLAPKWIQKVDVFILNESHPDYQAAWTRFLRQLNNPPERKPRPFTVPNVPVHFVNRPQQFDQLLSHVLDADRQNPVALTTALQGGGGFGKTTLAIALCHNEQVRVAFDDGILWVQFRENTTQNETLALLNQQIQLLDTDATPYIEITAAAARFRDLLKDRDVLIVLDDVWQESYLRYFIYEGTAYLITTRLQTVVTKSRAEKVLVDELTTDEATGLLAKWLDDTPTDAERRLLTDLAKRLGEWALLLELVGAELRSLMDSGRDLSEAVDFVVRRFERYGVTYLSRDDENERNLSISISLDASVSRLKDEWQTRFYELGVFPEDTDIPFATIEQLWGATAQYEDLDCEDALEAMSRLSLFTRYDARLRTLRLHDVILKLLRERLDDKVAVHQQLIAAWGDFTHLPDSYAWEHIALHLHEAHQRDTLRDLLLNFDFLQNKLNATNPDALIADCNLFPDNRHVYLVGNAIGLSLAFLSESKAELGSRLAAHLISQRTIYPEIDDLFQQLEKHRDFHLITQSQTFEAAGDTLIRTLREHSGSVNAVALSGDYAISASEDKTLKVWNWHTGALERTLH
jgi:hypothetical protein